MSVIDQELVVTGDIFGESDLTVKGVVKGAIFLQNADVRIERNGYVNGRVRAKTIMVDGEVEGDLVAETLLQLTKNAKVNGNILAAKLAMAEEAIFSGGLSIQEPEPVEVESREYQMMNEEQYETLRKWRLRNHVE